MKVLRVSVMFALLALSSALAAQSTLSPEAQLKAAIDREVVEGDFPAALEQYANIAATYRANRTVASKALLHLATLQEQLGRPEAGATYQRLITEYGDSGATAATARARLAAISQKDVGVVLRQVWEQRGSFPAWASTKHVSQDGTYMAFTDWKSGDLAIRDLSKGTDRLLTTDAHWPDSHYAENAVPLKDGSLIAYSWHTVGGNQPTELRLIGRKGGQPRVVYRNASDENNVIVAGWIPGSNSILATIVKGRSVTLVSIPAAGGAPRQLKDFDSPGPNAQSFSISPDGRFVAYTSRTPPRSPVWDVYLLSLETGAESALVSHQADDRFLGWFPDGDRILFVSDRSGAYGIWSLRVSAGRAEGDPIPIQSNTGLVSGAGFTKQGQFFFEATQDESNVLLAKIDPATGTLDGPLTPLDGRFVSGKEEAAFSPKGDRIAYVQQTATQPRRNQQLAIQTMATAQARLFPFALANIGTPVWMPDEQTLLIRGTDLAGVWSWYRVDAATGVLTPDHSLGGSPLSGPPAISSDGRRLIQVGMDESRRRGIINQDLSSGDFSLVFTDTSATATAGGVHSLALSPDQGTLAVTRRGGGALPVLFAIPTAGGNPTSLLASTDTDWTLDGQSLGWSRDGRNIFVVRKPVKTGGLVSEIWMVPIVGGPPRSTGIQVAGRVTRLSAHPDGRRLAISTVQRTSRTMVLQNIPR